MEEGSRAWSVKICSSQTSYNAVFSRFFSPVTCLGNFAILNAIRKTQELHSPSMILLCCLTVSDFLVSAISQQSLLAIKLAELEENVVTAQCGYSTSPGFSTATVPCFSLVAVSCDRLLLALTLYLRCDVVVTVPRVFVAACVLWTFSITVVLFTL